MVHLVSNAFVGAGARALTVAEIDEVSGAYTEAEAMAFGQGWVMGQAGYVGPNAFSGVADDMSDVVNWTYRGDGGGGGYSVWTIGTGANARFMIMGSQ